MSSFGSFGLRYLLLNTIIDLGKPVSTTDLQNCARKGRKAFSLSIMRNQQVVTYMCVRRRLLFSEYSCKNYTGENLISRAISQTGMKKLGPNDVGIRYVILSDSKWEITDR